MRNTHYNPEVKRILDSTKNYAPLRQSHSMSKLGNSSSFDLRKNARRIGTLTELKAKRKFDIGSSYDCSGKTIIYEGKRYEIHEGETFTKALQRIKGENWDAEELVGSKKIEEVPEKQEEQAPEVVAEESFTSPIRNIDEDDAWPCAREDPEKPVAGNETLEDAKVSSEHGVQNVEKEQQAKQVEDQPHQNENQNEAENSPQQEQHHDGLVIAKIVDTSESKAYTSESEKGIAPENDDFNHKVVLK